MAIDPSISLGVQTPQVQVNIPQPLQQFGQILSLQGLMQQRQLGQFQVEQAYQQQQERGALAKYFQGLTATPMDPNASPGSMAPAVDYGQVMRLAPTLGPSYVESHAKALKANLDSLDAQYKLAQDQNNARAVLTQGIVDEPTKLAAISKGFGSGLIDAPTRDHLLQIPYNDPRWQSFINQGLQTDQFLTQARENIKLGWEKAEAERKAALFPSQKTEAEQKAIGETLKTGAEQKSADASMLYAAASRGQPALDTAFASLPVDRQAPFQGVTADKPLDILNRAQTAAQLATAAESIRHNLSTEESARLNSAIAAGRLAQTRRVNDIEYGPGQAEFWAQQIYENPETVSDVPAKLKYAAGEKLKELYGLPLPKGLSQDALSTERASKNTLDAIAFIRRAAQNPEIQQRLGAVMGRLGEAEQDIGATAGMSPEASTLAQQLRTRMRYFVLGEGRPIVGGRVPASIMKQLETSSARVSMDPAMLEGALQGAEGAARDQLENIEKQRWGGKSRPPEARGLQSSTPSPAQQKALADLPKDGRIHQLSDGSVWRVNADGTITAAQPPR